MAALHLFRNVPGTIAIAAGKYIFRKGEAARLMYVIIEGEVDLVLGATVVETAAKGAFIGEMALIDNEPRSASARARSDCRVVPIGEARFRSLVRETPSFALQVMKTLARRLRKMDARIGTAPKAGKAKKAKKAKTKI